MCKIWVCWSRIYRPSNCTPVPKLTSVPPRKPSFCKAWASRKWCWHACRLPYQVLDSKGPIVAHEKHVLSMKDNNYSGNLGALTDAGVRSFKIEGRYKDMAYVKNITGHYRRLLDDILEQRSDLHAVSSGSVTLHTTPDRDKNFQRGSTDYFTNGCTDDIDDEGIAALDSPKNAGQRHRTAKRFVTV